MTLITEEGHGLRGAEIKLGTGPSMTQQGRVTPQIFTQWVSEAYSKGWQHASTGVKCIINPSEPYLQGYKEGLKWFMPTYGSIV